MDAPTKRIPVARDLASFISTHPGCTCPDAYAGLPHVSQSSIRSVISRLAASGIVASRGMPSHRRYFADQETADRLWKGPANVNAPPVRPIETRVRPMLQSYLFGRRKGSTVAEIAAHFNCTTNRASNVALCEVEAGRAFRCALPIGFGHLYFGTADDMEAAQPRLAAETAAFKREQQLATNAYQRRRAAKRTAEARKVERLKAKATEEPRKLPKPPSEPKPVLRHAGSAAHVPTAPVKRGPAALACEPDLSGARITRAPTPPGRFEVPKDFRGAFSTVGVGRDVQNGMGW